MIRLEARALYAAHKAGVRDRVEVIDVTARFVRVIGRPGLTSVEGKEMVRGFGVTAARREVVGREACWTGETAAGDVIEVATRPVTTTHRSTT